MKYRALIGGMLLSTVQSLSAQQTQYDKPKFKLTQFAEDKLDLLIHKQLEANQYCAKTDTKGFLIAGYDYTQQGKVNRNIGYHINNYYQLVGLTHDFEDVKLLVATGASESYMQIKNQYGHADFPAVYGSLGVGVHQNRWHYGVNALFGYSFIDASRNTLTGSSATTKHGSWTTSFDGHLSYQINRGSSEFVPYFNPSYLYGHENAYTESGAGAEDYQVKNENLSVLRSALGVKWVCPMDSWVKFFLDAAWLYEWFMSSSSFSAAYVGSSSYFKVNLGTPTKNYGRVDVGVMGYTDRFDWKISYTGLFGGHFAQQAATVKMGYQF